MIEILKQIEVIESIQSDTRLGHIQALVEIRKLKKIVLDSIASQRSDETKAVRQNEQTQEVCVDCGELEEIHLEGLCHFCYQDEHGM